MCIILAGTAQATNYTFRLQGDIINVNSGTVTLFSPVDPVRVLLTTEMKDGLFTLEGRLEEPGLYTLVIAGKSLPIVLDGKDMILYADYLALDTKLLKGSPAMKTRLALEKELREKYETRLNEMIDSCYQPSDDESGMSRDVNDKIAAGIRECHIFRQQLILAFIREHPDDIYLPVFLLNDMGKNREWTGKAYALLSARCQTSQPGRLLKAAF